MTKRKYNRAYWMGEASHEAAAPEEMQKMVSCKVNPKRNGRRNRKRRTDV